jgi:hypothetical protein
MIDWVDRMGGMKVLVAALLAILAVAGPVPAFAATAAPPTEFGTDWDDPRVAGPPVERPDLPSCTTTIVDTEFRDFTPYTNQFEPACGGPWQRVVLEMDGAVAGRQFDRLGYLKIGGVTVFKTSTPEPSAEGIRWSVEMLIANVVDSTYTGVLDITVRLVFYRGAATPQPAVLALDQALPRNTERLLADVYATGSGGGCEEFWYLTTPTGVPYSCPADDGPYREVQISIDGTSAGIAAPYPHIYTGGWSNPFLWYVLPAPRAFDIKPITYDLTPFVGLLTDGRVHDITVSVVGVSAGQSGWDVPAVLRAFRDPGRAQVTGALLGATEKPLVNRPVYTDHLLTTIGGHALTTTGYVDTSHGRVTTTVSRTVGNQSTHRWNADESQDALQATWTDRSVLTVGAVSSTSTLRYRLEGTITVDAANRLSSTMSLLDAATTADAVLTDTWNGEAAWTLNVPREQRHATGTSRERFRIIRPGPDYDRTIATENGTVVTAQGRLNGQLRKSPIRAASASGCSSTIARDVSASFR